jgi:hypothetical protein
VLGAAVKGELLERVEVGRSKRRRARLEKGSRLDVPAIEYDPGYHMGWNG